MMPIKFQVICICLTSSTWPNSAVYHAVHGFFKYPIRNAKTNEHFQEIYTDIVVQQ